MTWLRLSISFLAAAILFYVLNFQLGVIPPPGKLLDPFSGFWQNNATRDEIPQELAVSGLNGEVTVFWDDRHVPHIFAKNDHDLYFAQGYFTAHDRLWQMEFQIMAA